VQLVWTAYYDNCVPHAKPICGSFWWRGVAKMMNLYRGITTCKVRVGDTVLLWKDPWCSPVLSEASARLFSFTTSEDVSVAEFVGTQDAAVHFQLPLSIEAHEELVQLQELFNNHQLDPMTPDSWDFVWGSSKFKTRDFYDFCFRYIRPPEYIAMIWKSKCMMKHKVFAWLMLVDRINTRDMLRRRNLDIGTNFSCMTCDSGQDATRNHLFFGSGFTTDCWAELGLTWNTNLRLEDMIADGKTTWSHALFIEIVILGAWNIWKIRNKKLFEGVQPEIVTWKRQLRQDLEVLGYRIKEEHRTHLLSLVVLLT
jgi:hypothetical protein